MYLQVYLTGPKFKVLQTILVLYKYFVRIKNTSVSNVNMSTRRHFGIALLLCSMSLGYNYRLIENHEDCKTCPARNKEIPFEEPRLINQQRDFYNVHDIARRHNFNSNENEIKSENWFFRIFNIKNRKPWNPRKWRK